MTLALSTSSPVVSVALLDESRCIESQERLANQAASEAVALMATELLERHKLSIADLLGIVFDEGPGGFTGVKVGVTFAKTLAWANKLDLWSVSAFDLISPGTAVVVPSKKGQWYLRTLGSAPEIINGDLPSNVCGYGTGVENPIYPKASRAYDDGVRLTQVEAMAAVPIYLAEPSVSTPKNPHVLKGVRP